MPQDPHAVLGLSPSATANDVRRAFRRLVLELHPDRHHGDPTRGARLRAVVEAYETLTETKARPRRRVRRTARPAQAAPPPPRTRDRYGCPRCLDTFAYDAGCSRCDLPLVDEHREGRVRAVDDPRVDAMVAEIERRAVTGAWIRRIAPRVPAAAISSLLAAGAISLPIHIPVATMLLGYAVFLLGAEALSPSTSISG